MKASTERLLVQGKEKTTRKFRGQPAFKVYYGMMRKAAIIASVQQRGLKTRMMAEKLKKYELLCWKDRYDFEDVSESENSQCEKNFSDSRMKIKAKESPKDTFKFQNFAEDITTGNFNLLKKKFLQSQKIKAFANGPEHRPISPVQKSQLYRAFLTYECQVPPRMAIVLPKPLKGRTAWVDPIDYILQMRQYTGSPHMCMKLPPKGIWCLDQNERKKLGQDQLHATSNIAQKLYDIIGSLKSAADSFASTSQIPARSIKPKKTAYDITQRFILVLLTIVVFYIIWTSALPEEVLVTFSGLYTLMIIYLYSLAN